MSYVDNNLLPNEHVVYRALLHWFIYIPSVFLIVVGILIFLAFGSSGQDGGAAHNYFGGFFLLVGAVAFLAAWIRVKTSEFAVTDKRVVIKVGLIRRRSIELLLRQVEAIGVDQGILGRIVGYGGITVAGTGGTKELFRSISNPLEFRRQVQIQSTTTEGTTAPAQDAAALEKTCPRCAESVKVAAKVCRFCNHEFT